MSSVRDGVFRQYNGERSLNGLKNYIEFQEWQRTEPVSSYFAPDSIPYVHAEHACRHRFLRLFFSSRMAMISSLFDISVLVRVSLVRFLRRFPPMFSLQDAYTVLLEKHGWPAWLIYIVFSVIVIMIGFILGFVRRHACYQSHCEHPCSFL